MVFVALYHPDYPVGKGGMFGPTQKLDTTLPLYLQGDQLIYDTKGNRVIARGNSYNFV